MWRSNAIAQELRYLEIHEWARRGEESDILIVEIPKCDVGQLGNIVILELLQKHGTKE